MPITTITPYLKTTQELIQRAFPHGIQSDVYFPLLTILEPELSARHLALVIAGLTDKEDSQVLMDGYFFIIWQNFLIIYRILHLKKLGVLE